VVVGLTPLTKSLRPSAIAARSRDAKSSDDRAPALRRLLPLPLAFAAEDDDDDEDEADEADEAAREGDNEEAAAGTADLSSSIESLRRRGSASSSSYGSGERSRDIGSEGREGGNDEPMRID
jgi:hypothetical protein